MLGHWVCLVPHHLFPLTITSPSPQNRHLLASRAASPAAVETFVPSSPYAYAVQFAGEGVSDEAAAAAVTFEDLVAPVFLPCPPFVEDRTFPAAPGATEAVVALPQSRCVRRRTSAMRAGAAATRRCCARRIRHNTVVRRCFLRPAGHTGR